MPLKLTDLEKELMAKYELDEKDILAMRRQLALDEIRDSNRKAAEQAAAAAAAENEGEEDDRIFFT